MDLVDEQQGALAVAAALAGGLEDAAQVGDAGEHRRQGLEMQVGLLGQQAGDRRLAAARRPPQDRRAELARRQHAAKRTLGPEKMLLAQNVAQRLGPQAFGERCRGERGEELGRHGQRNWTVFTMPSRLMVTLETPPVIFFLRSATFFTSWPLTATIMSPCRTKRPA